MIHAIALLALLDWQIIISPPCWLFRTSLLFKKDFKTRQGRNPPKCAENLSLCAGFYNTVGVN